MRRAAGPCTSEEEESAPAVSRQTPNILIVVWDTVRADHLTPYGYERDTTPKLARFAADAVLYEHAISPGMWTLPSHASLFTGLPVSAHGANASHKELAPRFLTLAEVVQAAGVRHLPLLGQSASGTP